MMLWGMTWPQQAQKLGAGQISDVVGVNFDEQGLLLNAPLCWQGLSFVRFTDKAETGIVTVRPKSFDPLPPGRKNRTGGFLSVNVTASDLRQIVKM